jgi:hypothetical protein
MSHSNNDLTLLHSEKESAWAFRSIHAMQTKSSFPLMLDCIMLPGIYLVRIQHDAWMQTSGFMHAAQMTVTQMQ